MQRAGFTTLLGIVPQPYDTSFSNINAKPEKFFKLRPIFQTNLFSNVRSFKIGHIRNVSSYDSKITLKRFVAKWRSEIGGPLMSKNWRVRVLDRWKTREIWVDTPSSQLSAKWPRYGNGPGRERNRGGPSREWYWSRIECEETAVADSVPGGFLLWSARVWRNFARNIGTFEREVASRNEVFSSVAGNNRRNSPPDPVTSRLTLHSLKRKTPRALATGFRPTILSLNFNVIFEDFIWRVTPFPSIQIYYYANYSSVLSVARHLSLFPPSTNNYELKKLYKSLFHFIVRASNFVYVSRLVWELFINISKFVCTYSRVVYWYFDICSPRFGFVFSLHCLPV